MKVTDSTTTTDQHQRLLKDLNRQRHELKAAVRVERDKRSRLLQAVSAHVQKMSEELGDNFFSVHHQNPNGEDMGFISRFEEGMDEMVSESISFPTN
jgi:hypothetical protein